jgi:hypothetical protein
MLNDRIRQAWNVGSYVAASLVMCWGIWWFWRHGWPNPFGLLNMQKLQIYLFMGAPMGILMAIIAFFYGGKK